MSDPSEAEDGMERPLRVARAAVVAVGAVALFGAGRVALATSQLGDCGGDGGSVRAAAGSAQLDYCEAHLDLLALAAPLPLVVAAVLAPRRGRAVWVVVGAIIGVLIAASPVVVNAVLPNH